MRAITTKEFMERSRKIHNGKYDYSKTDLEHKDEEGKVVITCPIHGDFKQYPYNHLRGYGCSKCANNAKKDKKTVIKEIKEVHGNKYIIPDDFEYNGNSKTIHVICPVHGDFYPIYGNFVTKGKGCKRCTCHIYSNDEFIRDVKEIYGNLYSYDYIEFKGYRKKVKIKCLKCGKITEVFPRALLNGNFKCECSDSPYTMLEEDVVRHLKKLGIEYEYQFKRNWLRHKEPLSIDFYIPKYNVAIECQGRFHFEPYKKGDEVSIKNYKEQLERDKVKYDLCEKKNIKLMYYSNLCKEDYFAPIYENVNKLIEEIIKK